MRAHEFFKKVLTNIQPDDIIPSYMWQTRSDPVTQSYRDSLSQPVARRQRLTIFLFHFKECKEKMKKIAKSKGVMISSIISLLLSLAVLATVSMAWLSMNKETTSDGMKLNVQVTPNMIIDGDLKDDSDGDGADRITALENITASNFSISFDQSVSTLRPATHNDSSSTKLRYVTNPEDVSVSTGVPSGAVYSDAINVVSPAKKYYVDYTVYISSFGDAMPITSLTAELVTANCTIKGVSSSGNATLQAASIDFYVNGAYVDTLNVAGLNYSSNKDGVYNGGATKTSVTLQTGGSIPHNKAASDPKYITVTMRCYFDGALSSSTGTTYINTATVDTHDVALTVKFSATTDNY